MRTTSLERLYGASAVQQQQLRTPSYLPASGVGSSLRPYDVRSLLPDDPMHATNQLQRGMEQYYSSDCNEYAGGLHMDRDDRAMLWMLKYSLRQKDQYIMILYVLIALETILLLSRFGRE